MSVKEKIENIENKLSNKENNDSNENNDSKLSKKETVKEYNARYYFKNKDKVLASLSVIVECNICGKSIAKSGIKLHKSKPICRKTLEQKLRDEKTINDIKNNVNI